MQRAACSPNCAALTVPMPATRPSAGLSSCNSSGERRRRWAARAMAPYSMKLPASSRSARFSRTVRWPVLRRLATAAGRRASVRRSWRSSTSARSARICSRSMLCSLLPASVSTSAGSMNSSACASLKASPGAAARVRTMPPCPARTSNSIFIASSTATVCPAATASPSATSRATSTPLLGAFRARLPGGASMLFCACLTSWLAAK